MNAFELSGTSPQGHVLSIYACGKCQQMNRDKTRAEMCCAYCCRVCHKPVNNFILVCNDCRRLQQDHKDRERMEKAIKLDSWADGVLWEDHYYSTVEEAAESMQDRIEDGDELPEYLYVAKPARKREVELDRILEWLYDDMPEEDPEGYVRGIEEFQKAIDAFNEANKEVRWYDEDYTRAVRVPKMQELYPSIDKD